jgi:hypothetical protein
MNPNNINKSFKHKDCYIHPLRCINCDNEYLFMNDSPEAEVNRLCSGCIIAQEMEEEKAAWLLKKTFMIDIALRIMVVLAFVALMSLSLWFELGRG